MYKQRHKHSNKKSTASSNYAHIKYIATRPRVMKNEGMNHGLFGRLEVGEIVHFEDYKDVARFTYQNSRKGITMYRGIISFSDETAKELLLTDQKAWKRYMEKHIITLAEKNHIKREDFAFVCAVHNEKSHPHVHVAFWDKSQKVRSSYTHPQIPNNIRKQLIKDTFRDKILELSKGKDEATTSMRAITNEMVDEFDLYFSTMKAKEFQKVKKYYADEEQEMEYDFHVTDKFLNSVADKVFRIKNNLPERGRISYQLLPLEVKEEVDALVEYIIKNNKDIAELVETYVESKMKILALYGGTDDFLASQQSKYEKEAHKIIANRMLGMVKTINRIEYDMRSEEYSLSKKEFYTSQMLYSIMDMLKSTTNKNLNLYDETSKNIASLSKEAIKELYLKYQDKGYEH
ncbi:MAG: MobP3 family relaxase [Lachnospiraceae bacterium]